MFLCNLLLFNYQVITVLMNLIEMLISDSYHQKKKKKERKSKRERKKEKTSLRAIPLDGVWLVFPERSNFTGKSFTFVTVFAEFQGHSLLHHPCIIKLKPLHTLLPLQPTPLRTLAQSLSLHFPLTMRNSGLALLSEDKIIIKLKISIATIERVLPAANAAWTLDTYKLI